MNPLQDKANQLIAQGALTNSKRPETFVEGVYPTHVERGHGCYLWDVDGKKYFDFITGLGCNILGYAQEDINAAMFARMQKGVSLSLSTPEELKLAERLKVIFPFVDCMKFLKTGSEACSAAIRIARAYYGGQSGTENMQEVWFKEAFERISQEEQFHRWPSPRMQDVRQDLSISGSSENKQTGGAEAICQDIKGQTERVSARSNASESHNGIKSGQGLLSSEKSRLLRGTHQEFVRSMWRQELRSASSRLQSAAERDLVVSDVSCKGARWLILSDGYHGHHDAFVSLTHPATGVPPHFGILPLSGNEELIPLAAAVIIEPIVTDISQQRINWLKELRKKCIENDTLLIFDEVITGFRFPRFSVSNYYGIEPDLVILGKAIANGMPLAVVAGKKEVMNCDEYFVSSTFAGETLSLVAACKTIDLLKETYNLLDLWQKGEAWLAEFNSLWPAKIWIEGYPTRGRFEGDPLIKALFFQEACQSGMLFGPSWFFNFPLAEKSKITLGAVKDIICKIKSGSVTLRGQMPKSPFAERVRQPST